MGKIMIGILDGNQAYSKRLSNYIINNYEGKYTASYYSSFDNVKKYLDKGLDIDILLINEELYDENLQCDQVTTFAILTNEKIDDINGIKAINKYQPANKIVSELLNCLAESSDKKFVLNRENKKTKVAAVYSPIGGSGKTSIALGIAVYYSKLGKKVLYINLENLESMSAFLEVEKVDNLSELLYFIKEGNSNLRVKMDVIRKVDENTGVQYISPFNSCLDKIELQCEDIKMLFEELRKLEEYDYIIIDLDSNIDKTTISIFEEVDKIIVIAIEEMIAVRKIENFAKELTRMSEIYNMDYIEDKILLISNKINGGTSCSSKLTVNNKEIPISGRIPYIQEIYENSGNKAILNGTFIGNMNCIDLL